MLAESFQRVSAATGLSFVNDGATAEAPSTTGDRGIYQPDRYGDRWAPVLVAWATPQEVPDFGVDIAGEAGPVAVSGGDGGSAVYVSGTVYLDPAKISSAERQIGEPAARAIVLHELGHLVGLDHVADEDQVMWPRGNSRRLTEYQPGDLAGLARLGNGPCRRDV
ncbi:MAG: matrixin family metalloprotease [Actinomycetales bacterium]